MGSYNFFNDTHMTDSKPSNNPERRLWRAVLNQALEDGFGMYTTYMSGYEKIDAKRFVRTRTKHLTISVNVLTLMQTVHGRWFNDSIYYNLGS